MANIKAIAEHLIREHNNNLWSHDSIRSINVILSINYLDEVEGWGHDYDSQLTPEQAQSSYDDLVKDCEEGDSPNMVDIHLAVQIDGMPYGNTELCVYINNNHPHNKI